MLVSAALVFWVTPDPIDSLAVDWYYAKGVPTPPNRLGRAGMNLARAEKRKANTSRSDRPAQVIQHTPITGTSVDRSADHLYNAPMNNRTMHLTLAELANADMNSDAWVWQDDMITFCDDDENESDALIGLSWYGDGSAERILADLIYSANATQNELDFDDHPICGEFPHDSIVAPRGWDKVDTDTDDLTDDDWNTFNG